MPRRRSGRPRPSTSSELARPDRLQLVDGAHALSVEVKRVMLRLPAMVKHPWSKHGGAQAAGVADAAIENAVSAFPMKRQRELLARSVVVRQMAVGMLAHVDEPRIDVGEVQAEL